MANTPNLGLHQWQPEDEFVHTAFNEDHMKIDTAVGAGLKSLSSTFAGNGAYPRKITLPRRPKLVCLGGSYRQNGLDYVANLFLADGGAVPIVTGPGPVLEAVTLLDDGFQIIRSGCFNEAGRDTQYFCLY